MKGLRLTKIINEITFEEVSGKLESKMHFQRQSFTTYLKLIPDFFVKQWTAGKVQFLFLMGFLLVLKKTLFWQEDLSLHSHAMTFRHFCDIF